MASQINFLKRDVVPLRKLQDVYVELLWSWVRLEQCDYLRVHILRYSDWVI